MKNSSEYKSVVIIGGGSGTSAVLEGLKKYPVNLSAIITTADNGGSSGKLRDEFEMIPPGDIRQCLVALASRNYGYLNDRFQEGSLQGHTLGNLLITLFYQKNKDFQQAIDELLVLAGAKGSLIPATLRPVNLVAKFSDGSEIVGEKSITRSRIVGEKLKRMMISPAATKANPKAISAIKNADVIIVGPGNLFSSVIPNFLVREIRDSFKNSGAKKIYIANLFTQPGHTDKFSISDFERQISKYAGGVKFDYIIHNTASIPDKILKKYKNSALSHALLANESEKGDKRFIGGEIARLSPKEIIKSDPMAKNRNPFLHDSKRVAKIIMGIVEG